MDELGLCPMDRLGFFLHLFFEYISPFNKFDLCFFEVIGHGVKGGGEFSDLVFGMDVEMIVEIASRDPFHAFCKKAYGGRNEVPQNGAEDYGDYEQKAEHINGYGQPLLLDALVQGGEGKVR